MKTCKIGTLIAAVVLAAVALLAGSAGATISPDPYSTTSGSGAFNTIGAIGNGSCNLSGIVVRAAGTAGTISGFTATGCRGTLQSARFVNDIAISSPAGSVSVDAVVEIGNIFGGTCEYEAALSGVPNRTSSVTLSGTAVLVRTVSGICRPSANASVTLTLPGATVA